MGIFKYTVTLYSPDMARSEQVSALVDTGSLFTWIPAAAPERLEIPRGKAEAFKMANGEVITRDTADVAVDLDGVRHVTAVVFGEPGDQVLLGALTLERFLLMPDSVNRRLVPMVPPAAVTIGKEMV